MAMGVMRSKGNDGGFRLKENERESKEINSCREEEEEFVGKKMIPLLFLYPKRKKKNGQIKYENINLFYKRKILHHTI